MFTWAYLLSTVFMILGHERFMGAFHEERQTSSFIWVGSYVLFYIATTTAFFLFNVPILSVSVNASMLFLITFNYKSSFKKRMAVVFTALTSGILVDSFVATFMVGLSHVDMFETVGFSSVTGIIIMNLTFYLLALCFVGLKNILNRRIETLMLFKLATLMVPFASSIVTFMIIEQLTTLSFSLILGFNLFVFILLNSVASMHEEKVKAKLNAQEKEYYFSQSELMVETVEVVKSIRHDMKLHLATLKDYTERNPSDAVAYIEYLMEDINKSEVYSDTGNVALDSIINYKLKNAKQDDIEATLKIFAPSMIGIEAPDIVTILGNLLDNALEAVSKVEKKWISLHVAYQAGNLFIRAENTFDGIVKKDFATLKSGDGHGYGLKNVRKSVDKYDGVVDVSHENGTFAVEVLLYGSS